MKLIKTNSDSVIKMSFAGIDDSEIENSVKLLKNVLLN
jgi:hypothetical protein